MGPQRPLTIRRRSMLDVPDRSYRPRVRFSPEGYKKAKREWEHGRPQRLIAMMKEAALDTHTSGCLGGRRSGFKRRWTLTAYEDEERDQARRDFFSGLLQRLRLRDLLEALFESRLYGFSVVDFEWTVEDGRQVPTRFRDFDHRHFKRAGDDPRGEIVIDGDGAEREIPDTALVAEARDRPLMLPVLRDYILKNFGLESWAAFLETFGEPFILGKYPPEADSEFVDKVEEGVQQLGSSSRGTAPQGTDLEIHETGRSTGDHRSFTEQADKGIAIHLLGHANAVEDSGSVNVGGVQTSYEVRFDYARDDMHYLDPLVNELIQLVGQRNFGDGRYPKFELDKSPPVSKAEHADIVDMAWRHGVPIQAEEYRRLGIHVDEGEGPFQKESTPTSALLD